MIYSVDTSALMEAWVRYYPPDVFPTLWERIEELIEERRFVATDEVLHELEKKEDELHNWASQRAGMFVPLDEKLQKRAAQIINDYDSLTNTDRTRGTADPFVIALAMEQGLTVVTAESSKPSKPRIPDVCKDLGIPCITLVELFRKEKWEV